MELPEGRRTRVFVRDASLLSRLAPVVVELFMDDGDREREPALREVLSGHIVYVDAHAGVGPSDLRHVFVRRSEREGASRIFACVIVTEARMEKMLEAEPHVIETFSFQIAPGRVVTTAGTVAAFEAWFGRVFPGMKLPAVRFDQVTSVLDR
jgi:hypothetical protein